jgi:tRNA modification GTPase
VLDAINSAIASKYGEAAPDLPMLTRARHQHALTNALAEIRQFQQAWREEKLPAPVASVHLRAAVYVLEELIGAVDVEDVLDRVFSSFCVGK